MTTCEIFIALQLYLQRQDNDPDEMDRVLYVLQKEVNSRAMSVPELIVTKAKSDEENSDFASETSGWLISLGLVYFFC